MYCHKKQSYPLPGIKAIMLSAATYMSAAIRGIIIAEYSTIVINFSRLDAGVIRNDRSGLCLLAFGYISDGVVIMVRIIVNINPETLLNSVNEVEFSLGSCSRFNTIIIAMVCNDSNIKDMTRNLFQSLVISFLSLVVLKVLFIFFCSLAVVC